MEEVTLDTLRDSAAALAAEAKSLSRRSRSLTQQAAALRDDLVNYSPKEDTSEHTEYHNQ